MRSKIRRILRSVILASLIPASAFAQSEDAVKQAKADLVQAGVDLQGACGAAKIANLVAWRARPQYRLLFKAGGNRAVLKADGSCLDGDHSREGGFATDYLIDKDTFFGYDILGDGGTKNTPQWPDQPEVAADMVSRNRHDNVAPIDPAGYFHAGAPAPAPAPVPAPTPAPAPAPTVDLGPINVKIGSLENAVVQLRDALNAAVTRLDALEQDHGDEVSGLLKRIVVLEARPIVRSCSARANFGFGSIPISCKVNP